MSRILIVDDDPGTTETLGALIRDAGYEVITANTGLEGVLAAVSFRPHLALVDLRLPDISGTQVVRQLRESTPSTVCVILTGFGTCASAHEAGRLGVADYVEKPLIGDAVVAVIEKALSAVVPETRIDVSHESHALKRWATIIVRFVGAPEDAPTLRKFGHQTGVAAGTFRNWCRTAALSPRKSLMLARVLRAVTLQSRTHAGPENLLDVIDRRTLVKLMTASGGTVHRLPHNIGELLDKQRLIDDPTAIDAIREALAVSPGSADSFVTSAGDDGLEPQSRVVVTVRRIN